MKLSWLTHVFSFLGIVITVTADRTQRQDYYSGGVFELDEDNCGSGCDCESDYEYEDEMCESDELVKPVDCQEPLHHRHPSFDGKHPKIHSGILGKLKSHKEYPERFKPVEHPLERVLKKLKQMKHPEHHLLKGHRPTDEDEDCEPRRPQNKRPSHPSHEKLSRHHLQTHRHHHKLSHHHGRKESSELLKKPARDRVSHYEDPDCDPFYHNKHRRPYHHDHVHELLKKEHELLKKLHQYSPRQHTMKDHLLHKHHFKKLESSLEDDNLPEVADYEPSTTPAPPREKDCETPKPRTKSLPYFYVRSEERCGCGMGEKGKCSHCMQKSNKTINNEYKQVPPAQSPQVAVASGGNTGQIQSPIQNTSAVPYCYSQNYPYTMMNLQPVATGYLQPVLGYPGGPSLYYYEPGYDYDDNKCKKCGGQKRCGCQKGEQCQNNQNSENRTSNNGNTTILHLSSNKG